MDPKVSVIIPCYNQGQTIDETIRSVLSQTFDDFEIIVVNDGSTDPLTIDHLQSLDFPQTTVIHTQNMGLPSARNNGIREAKGRYILPLDSDDRIGTSYLEQAVALLEDDPAIGIVYCKARFFGARNGEWVLPEYSLEEMLLNNVIFCTAFFRKSDWQMVGGFDPAMVHGWEDYDFWLSLIEAGRKVVRIPEILFEYRVSPDSMLRSREKKQKVEILVNIFHKHEKLYKEKIDVLFDQLVDIKGVYHEAALAVTDLSATDKKLLATRRVELDTKTLRFDQLRWPDDGVFLFSPINDQVIVNIKSVLLTDEQGHEQPVRLESNSYLETDGLSFFNTRSPEIRIVQEVGRAEGELSLSIDLEYLIIGESVPDHIVSRQGEQLDQLRVEADGLKRSMQNMMTERRSLVGALGGVMRAVRTSLERIYYLLTDKDFRLISQSGLFDENFYCLEYPDILLQGVNPLVHYCRTGWRENRWPNRHFDPVEYQKKNDLPGGSSINPLAHSLRTTPLAAVEG